MNSIKRASQAVEFRLRASEASALAEASPLGHVRDKHAMAAARWLELAELNEPQAAPPGLAPVAVVTGA